MDGWQGLLGVLVGGLLAGGFGWITQRRADDQAAAKEARDREHEHQVWARQMRYQAHAQFLVEFGRLHKAVFRLHRG